MTSRGRHHLQDWEREEFDKSCNAQYPDEDTYGGVQLDHCKLYVTNISKAMNEVGLTTAFSKYGTLVRVHVSKDPSKRYALITYESPGEAKLAMMKLNKTEPLKLNINIAHKKNNQEPREPRDDTRRIKQRESSSYRDDGSVSSKGRRKQDEFTNGIANEMDENLCDEDLGLDEVLDAELELELTQLRFQQLKLQQAQLHCKQQMLLLNKGKKTTPKSNRCILPDGRIVVRNASEKSDQPDNTYTSAAGDSLTLPTLQRTSSRSCLACGGTSDLYCGGCGIAPYCSQNCQQKDWSKRHKNVCHNLACSSNSEFKIKGSVGNDECLVSSPTSLHHPHPSQNKDNQQDVNKTKRNFTPDKSSRTVTTFKHRSLRRPNIADDREDGTDRKEIKQEKAESKQPEKPNYPKPEPLKTKPEIKPEPLKPKPDDEPADQKKPLNPPGSISDVTPKTKTVVPKEFIVETLSLGDAVLLSVDSTAEDCRADSGFICLALHSTNEQDYQMLCGEFGEECEKEKDIVPRAGELYALFYKEDDAWYRARCVSSREAALVDCSRVVALGAEDRSRTLPPRYMLVPECCCRLTAPVQLGDNLKVTLVSKTADGFNVSIQNAETEGDMGEGEITRWRPAVEYELDRKPVNASIPEVPRPALSPASPFLLVHFSGVELFLRPAVPPHLLVFDQLIQDGLAAGMEGLPLAGPVRAGQPVLCRHTDGLYYRAMVKRTNVAKNKYMVEFLEYGNTDITTLENLSPCPDEMDMTKKPPFVSSVKLDMKLALSKNGQDYLERLIDEKVELILNPKNKSDAIPSGCTVDLIEDRTKTSVTRKLEQMCLPDWKKLEMRGGDVVECPSLMYSSLRYGELPDGPCRLAVVDISAIRGGGLGICTSALDHQRCLDELTEQIEAYVKSDLGKLPYLPRDQELCLAPCPPHPHYYRAVLCSHSAGSKEATVCYFDYNKLETVDVASLRKMMPEFMTAPALAYYGDIKGFPASPTDEQVARAVQHLEMDDAGRGSLSVEKCEKVDPGYYLVDAPGLLAAINQE